MNVQVIAIIAKEKSLELDRRPKKNMYIEDVAEFARVLLTTTEMTFDCGWQRIFIEVAEPPYPLILLPFAKL